MMFTLWMNLIYLLNLSMMKSIGNFFVFFFTDVRSGEALALKFKDLSNGYITISKTMNSHGKRNIGTTKTISSNRKIIIDKRFIKFKKRIFKKKYTLNDD